MRATVIACEVFRREFEHVASQLPHDYTFHYEPFGLHGTPENLASHLQGVVDQSNGTDRVLLAYGLCSRGIVGLAARDVPIVVPRAHDCMTLFLGSRERYMTQFGSHPGTYYLSPGWIDRYDPSVTQAQMGFVEQPSAAAQSDKYAEYVEKYGEENAQYLLQVESQWQEHYTRTVYIDTGVGNKSEYQAFVQRVAEERGWEYGEIAGDTGLIKRLLNGPWDDDFLIVEPHHEIRDTAHDDIIRAESLRRIDSD